MSQNPLLSSEAAEESIWHDRGIKPRRALVFILLATLRSRLVMPPSDRLFLFTTLIAGRCRLAKVKQDDEFVHGGLRAPGSSIRHGRSLSAEWKIDFGSPVPVLVAQ